MDRRAVDQYRARLGAPAARAREILDAASYLTTATPFAPVKVVSGAVLAEAEPAVAWASDLEVEELEETEDGFDEEENDEDEDDE